MISIVIADTSCLILYDKLNRWDILRNTFQNVIITKEVAQEFGNVPNWLTIRQINNKSTFQKLKQKLDMGEASAITLSLAFRSLKIMKVDIL